MLGARKTHAGGGLGAGAHSSTVIQGPAFTEAVVGEGSWPPVSHHHHGAIERGGVGTKTGRGAIER